MKIGILKEPGTDRRVVLLPESVAQLVKLKVNIAIESGAGANAFASDDKYRQAGAEILSRVDVLKQSDAIVAISPPGKEDLKKLQEGKILIALLNPLMNREAVEELSKAGLTSFSLEMIPRTTRAQSMDILSSMATVAGYKAVLDAASNLPAFFPMFMTAAGTIKPSKVLILGAGVAGLQAIATARRLGAVVEVFDVRSAVKEEVKSLGAKFIEVEGAKDDIAAGGYAVEQTEEYKKKQQQLIHDSAIKSNVVISTAQIPGKKAPVLLRKETVEQMLPGSVIIDLAASTGGNCELTKGEGIIEHNLVKIIGNSNYASEMPSDASKMFGQNLVNFLKLMIDGTGNLVLNFEDDIIKGTCITHQKQIVNERVKEIYNQ